MIHLSAVPNDFEGDRFAYTFASAELPIPEIVAMSSWHRGVYAISERVQGGSLDDLDASGMERHVHSLLQVREAMHRIGLFRTAGFGCLGPDGNTPHPSWREFLRVEAPIRLRCDMLHIGLAQMRYSASIEHWDQCELEARRALGIARSARLDMQEPV